MADLHLDVLDRVRIASPCPMRWEDMEGDDATRHCDRCDLNVTNLSAMTREQAAAWVHDNAGKGRVCAGFYRRPDGTILTRDCPVGLALLRQRALHRTGKIAAAIAMLLTGGLLFARSDRQRSLAEIEPMRSLREWLRPTPLTPAPVPRGFTLGGCRLPAPDFDLNEILEQHADPSKDPGGGA